MFEIDGKLIHYNPLCGMEWLRQHYLDHTHAEMEAQTIQVGIGGKTLPPLRADTKRGTIKTIVKGG